MRSILVYMCCLCLISSVAGCGSKQDSGQAQALASLNPNRDFVLTDHNGNEFQLKDHRGKVVLLFFGFLSCPDICPVTLSKLTRVYNILDPKAKDVLTIFVSVDPQRDTPEKMKEYLSYFKLNAVGLTGTKEQIDRVVDAFKGYYQMTDTDSAAGYLVDHSSYVYVIDAKGVVRALAHFEDGADKIASVVKPLL